MLSFLKATPPSEGRRYVFIFTYGRSGSTLLSGLLNALPGCCIRGENYMALAHLNAFYGSLKKSKAHMAKKSGQPTHPWYGVDDIDLASARQKVRDLFVDEVLRPPQDAFVVGFKEIRINVTDIPDLDGFLDDLVEIFEDVKFVFNHRRITDVAKSKWWGQTLQSHARIHSMDMRLERSRHVGTDRVFQVYYERLVAEPQHAKELADFLGLAFSERTYRKVMSVRHSY
ncbi:sulfotransferase [Labrenzia sp. CE80]|uniref:sulfotransferase n=1 Tax=Labrenzia sp. CE80 TaxID=1788986 RepID=UPI00138A1A85|nr:sulfotransferase [Labrenzia sp. CE80]